MLNTTGWKQLERRAIASSFRERSPRIDDQRRSAPTGRRFAPSLGTAHPLSYASGILFAAFLLTTPTLAEDSFLGTDNVSFSGSVEIEGTFFAEDPRFAGQDDNAVSTAVRSKLILDWDSTSFGADSASLTISPFVRFDPQDNERTHADLREAKLDLRFGETDVTIGNDFIFWGKTEVDQIVDIINQTDGVEGTDGEDKLGQPMIRLSRLVDIGEFSGEASVFYLPYFRERTFLGEESRLRGAAVIEGDNPRYETGADEWTPSFAARLAGFYGDFDIGVSAFHGLSRDPAIESKSSR